MRTGWLWFWLLVCLVGALAGAALLVDYVYDHDVRVAEEHCAALGAEPHYTYRTRYICLTPDGRVVE